MMTRRWFLKLVSAFAPLFGVKAEAEAECPFKGEINTKPEDLRIPTPVKPETKTWLHFPPGTLTGAVLKAGCVYDLTRAPMSKSSFEYVEEAEYHRMKACKLDTVELIEQVTLGIGEPIRYVKDDSLPDFHVYGVFNHPNAIKHHDAVATDIYGHVVGMMQELAERKFYGPYVVLIPWRFMKVQMTEFDDLMQLERVQEVVGYGDGTQNKIALVQLTPDVIQMIVCRDRIVPRIRSDMFGNCGIVIAEES